MHILQPFADKATGPVERIEVELARDGLVMWLRFAVKGDVDAVKWPPQLRQGRGDDLWKHTCFEVFVRTASGYREYNLSPSGQWATYAFDGYRSGKREAEEVATVLGMVGAADHAAMEAKIELPSHVDGAFGLSAVIEALDGTISYWALAHRAERPDFHHPDSFVLTLPERYA